MRAPGGARAPTTCPRIRSVVTYLEMTAPPVTADATGPPAADVRVEHCRTVSCARYRSLYRRVGEPWLWWERLSLTDTELAALVQDPALEIRLLRAGDDILGYSELDRSMAAEPKIAYFGLVAEAIGRGLGRLLMDTTLAAAWARSPRRVWLHTCTEDHPRALAFYQAAGFRPYRVETLIIDDPRTIGLLPADAAPHVPLAR